MKTEKKPTIHLYLIGILLVLFVSLLFLSGSSKGIEITYEFTETTSTAERGVTRIGEVEIMNTGFIPKRAQLNSYAACDTKETQYYSVNYQKSDETSYLNGYKEEFVDLSPYEERTLGISLSYYPSGVRNQESGENGTENETRNIGLFLLPQGVSGYEFCEQAEIQEAQKVITITDESR